MSQKFQKLFHSLSTVLFTFPSRYYSLSVAASCLALDRGRPGFRQGFSGLAVLRNQSHKVFVMSRTGLSPSSTGLPMPFRYDEDFSNHAARHAPDPHTSCNPQDATVHTLHASGLGSSDFARRYFRNLVPDFYSSGYLDGSVPRVFPYHAYLIQHAMSYLLI